MPSAYDIRLIQAGRVIEKIEYENPVIVNEKVNKLCVTCIKKGSGRKQNASEDDKIKNREIVLYRARNEVRRLINANVDRYWDEMENAFKPVFLTLTFADNIKSISLANKEFRKFIKRLGYYVNHDQTYLKYVAVPEFQKRGAVHYHLIIFNLPYIKTNVISTIWTHGYIKINVIDSVTNLGAYVCKYMTKTYDAKGKLAGQKCYLRSRRLHEPIEMNILSTSPAGHKVLKTFETMPLSNTYTKVHNSEHYGLIKYTQFECDDFSSSVVTQDESLKF
jgi:hypothetical protein